MALYAEGKHRTELLNKLCDDIMLGVNYEEDSKHYKLIKALVEAEIQTYSNRELREALGMDF